MKLSERISLMVVAILTSMLLVVPQASAVINKWNGFENNPASNAITVYWCSGGTYLLQPGVNTTKDICAVKVKSGRYVFAYVAETGRVLIDKNYCDTKKVKVTKKTKTKGSVAFLYQVYNGCA